MFRLSRIRIILVLALSSISFVILSNSIASLQRYVGSIGGADFVVFKAMRIVLGITAVVIPLVIALGLSLTSYFVSIVVDRKILFSNLFEYATIAIIPISLGNLLKILLVLNAIKNSLIPQGFSSEQLMASDLFIKIGYLNYASWTGLYVTFIAFLIRAGINLLDSICICLLPSMIIYSIIAIV